MLILPRTGAITIVPVCFIAPCIFYLAHKGVKNVKLWEKTLIGFTICVNSVIMVLGVIASVRQIVLDVQYYKMFS